MEWMWIAKSEQRPSAKRVLSQLKEIETNQEKRNSLKISKNCIKLSSPYAVKICIPSPEISSEYVTRIETNI